MYFSLPYSQRWPPHGKLRSSKLLQIHAYWTTLALEAIKSVKRQNFYGVFCRTLVHHSGRAHGSSHALLPNRTQGISWKRARREGKNIHVLGHASDWFLSEACVIHLFFVRPLTEGPQIYWILVMIYFAVSFLPLLSRALLSVKSVVSGKYEFSIYDARTERGRVSSSWIKSGIQHHRLRIRFTLHAKDVAWYQSSLTL